MYILHSLNKHNYYKSFWSTDRKYYDRINAPRDINQRNKLVFFFFNFVTCSYLEKQNKSRSASYLYRVSVIHGNPCPCLILTIMSVPGYE